MGGPAARWLLVIREVVPLELQALGEVPRIRAVAKDLLQDEDIEALRINISGISQSQHQIVRLRKRVSRWKTRSRAVGSAELGSTGAQTRFRGIATKPAQGACETGATPFSCQPKKINSSNSCECLQIGDTQKIGGVPLNQPYRVTSK